MLSIMKPRFLILLSLLACLPVLFLSAQKSRFTKSGNKLLSSRLRISDNQRFLQFDDETPFFYLGDTAWELFHRLNKEEAKKYLEDRAKKGFTVIQAVVLAELDGIITPNAYGFLPLTGKDPAHPATKEGPDNDYWDQVDYVVETANQLGLVIGMLPTWGRYWHDNGQVIFNEQNAGAYGEFLGKRYKDAQVIWILGGDRNAEQPHQKTIIRAMANGLKSGDEGKHLLTYHPSGWRGSSEFFHHDDWLDFNMRQNGHETEHESYMKTLDDYNRTPVKPVLDGEPIYEGHPIAFNAKKFGHSIAFDTRRALYWDLFNGACGHTYGHHAVWQMYDSQKTEGINTPLQPWYEAINEPGAIQMLYGRLLIESRPYFSRIPATDEVLAADKVPTSVPGAGRYRFAATRDTDGTYAMVYVPIGRTFTVRMHVIRYPKVKAWWYNPRTGKATAIGTFTNEGEKSFVSPNPGEMIDWILVLDDASKKYPAPGK